MTEALKPCPFCLGPARVYGNDLGNNEWIARCRNIYTCGARGSAWLSEAEAIAAWNHRAALAQPPAPTAQQCTCPSGDGSLRWPCPQHPANIAQPVQQPEPEVDGWPLYSGLPPAQRQPLSDEEIEAIWKAHVLPWFGERQKFYSPVVYARAIEAAHGITAAPAAQKGEKL